jgi:hypothetical protein
MEDSNLDIYSKMQTDAPYKTYKKTILGKVYLTVINPFSGEPEGIIVSGDPKKNEGLIDIWDIKQDMFFRRSNKRQFEMGNIIEYKRPIEEQPKEREIESYSDEELKEVINQKFMALQHTVNKIKTETVLIRMIDLAREMEKSEKIIKVFEARLAELQQVGLT